MPSRKPDYPSKQSCDLAPPWTNCAASHNVALVCQKCRNDCAQGAPLPWTSLKHITKAAFPADTASGGCQFPLSSSRCSRITAGAIHQENLLLRVLDEALHEFDKDHHVQRTLVEHEPHEATWIRSAKVTPVSRELSGTASRIAVRLMPDRDRRMSRHNNACTYAATPRYVEIWASVAFSASLTGTPPKPRKPPSAEASATA